MKHAFPNHIVGSLVLLLCLLTSCSRSSGTPGTGMAGAPASQTTTVDFVLRTTGDADLFALRARLVEVRLERMDGTLTDNLLVAEIPVEFLRLRDVSTWMARRELQPGDYQAVVIRFVEDAYTAASDEGDAVEVLPVDSELRAPFITPIQIVDQPYLRFATFLDLPSSVTAGASTEEIDFDPTGATRSSVGGLPLVLESRLGLVRQRDPATSLVALDLFADQALQASIGTVTAEVLPGALMVNPVGFVETLVPYYLTYLTPGASIVDVRGELSEGGEFRLASIEIEEQNGSVVSPRFPVKIEGEITQVLSSAVFEMRVRNVPRGGFTMEPLLGAPTIQVTLDPQTALLFVGPLPVPVASLLAGDEVSVKSEQLSTSPVIAARVTSQILID